MKTDFRDIGVGNLKLGRLGHRRCSTFQRENSPEHQRLWPNLGENSPVVVYSKETTVTISIISQLGNLLRASGLLRSLHHVLPEQLVVFVHWGGYNKIP